MMKYTPLVRSDSAPTPAHTAPPPARRPAAATQRGRRRPAGRQQHRRIGADAEERGLAEAHQAGAAHQQFQAERKDGVDHDLGDQVHAEAAGQQRQQRQQPRRRRHEGGLGASIVFIIIIRP
jgi:hypothetical protein